MLGTSRSGSHRAATLIFAATLLAAGALWPSTPQAAETPDASTAPAAPNYSRAEQLVFVDHHLANINASTALRYGFVKSGSLEPGFEDRVELDLQSSRGACCKTSGRFLSAERRINVPDVDDAKANPVILFFLENDIRQMQRLTKGQAAHFRKRIRLALVDEATVREVQVSYNGRDVPAQEVVVSPYLNDPNRNRFERYATKRYTFVLAPAVPGGVYQLRTALPGALPTDAPVLEEVLTFSGAAPLAPSSSSK
jgi:hypothetical protein